MLLKPKVSFQASNAKIRTVETEVFVVSAQKHLAEERMKICRELWNADIKVSVKFKPTSWYTFYHVPVSL